MKLAKLILCFTCFLIAAPFCANAQVVAKIQSGTSSIGAMMPGGSVPLSSYTFNIKVTSNRAMLLSSAVAGWELTKYYQNLNGQTLAWTRVEKVPATFSGPTWVNTINYTVYNSGYPVDQLNRLIFRILLQGDSVPTQVQVQ